MRNKGSFNRRTGKTTPRSKAKTHWGRPGEPLQAPANAQRPLLPAPRSDPRRTHD